MPYGYTMVQWNEMTPQQRSSISNQQNAGKPVAGDTSKDFAVNQALKQAGVTGVSYAGGTATTLGGKSGNSSTVGQQPSPISTAVSAQYGLGPVGTLQGGATGATGGAAGTSGAGGAGAGGYTGAGGGDLTIASQQSPELQKNAQLFEAQLAKLQQQGQKVDQNLQFQIDEYKKRLGEGPTTRAIEQSASAIRDQMAGLSNEAEMAGAAGGRGQGFMAGGIGEAAQRALAGSSANIALGRQGQLDQLLLGGQQIMQAPGQREMAYDTLSSNFFGNAPYQAAANYGLGSQQLGLQAYLGQGDLNIRNAALQQQSQGTPLDWMKLLYGF